MEKSGKWVFEESMFRHQPKTPTPLSAFPNIANSTTPIYQFRLLEGSGFGVMIVKPLAQMKIGFWFEVFNTKRYFGYRYMSSRYPKKTRFFY
jgi:hypothetical protein